MVLPLPYLWWRASRLPAPVWLKWRRTHSAQRDGGCAPAAGEEFCLYMYIYIQININKQIYIYLYIS